MNKQTNRISGSALLLTLLVLVGIGGTVLTVTRLVLNLSSQVSDSGDYQIASRVADAGLQSALYYLTNDTSSAPNEMNGLNTLNNQAISYNFAQGFTPNTGGLGCSTNLSSPNTSTLDTAPPGVGIGCPWFSVVMTPSVQATQVGGTIIGDSDLPITSPPTTTTYIASGSGTLSVWGAGSATVTMPTQTLNPIGNGAFIQLNPGNQFIISRPAKTSFTSLGITSSSTSLSLTRLNYECISAIGHSGNISVGQRIVRIYSPNGGIASQTTLLGSDCNAHLPDGQ